MKIIPKKWSDTMEPRVELRDIRHYAIHPTHSGGNSTHKGLLLYHWVPAVSGKEPGCQLLVHRLVEWKTETAAFSLGKSRSIILCKEDYFDIRTKNIRFLHESKIRSWDKLILYHQIFFFCLWKKLYNRRRKKFPSFSRVLVRLAICPLQKRRVTHKHIRYNLKGI